MNPKTFENLVKHLYINSTLSIHLSIHLKLVYTSTLDYCDVVYGNACKKELQRVQRSQNFAARVVTKK